MVETKHTGERGAPFRLARALASPLGVLVTLPVLVIVVGIGIMLVGRSATVSASMSMARHQLAEHATSVQADVAFALDQADPLLARMRVIADPSRPTQSALVQLHQLMVGRPGIAFDSISFPDGTFRGVQLMPDGTLLAQESHVDSGQARWYNVVGEELRETRTETTTYDPRTRPFYVMAASIGARVWTEPYTFYRSHETGVTCAEPLFDANHTLVAVLTVDFHVQALSSFVARPALDQARSFVYTRDGTMLAYPSADKLALPTTDKLLRHEDLGDHALDRLFTPTAKPNAITFFDLDTEDGEYLASVAPIGGKRAGVAAPLDWYVATLVPAHTLLGPTHALERSSVLASAGAMAIAVGLALVLAWNLVRMRRQVAASRAEARTAEARARELGSYKLVARLGAGGMGEVWRAEHRLLARTAAIKLIRPEVLHDRHAVSEVRERFRREAQTLASMKCRHTIAIYDYGVTAEGVFYYVMELLDGLDLESLVVRYGPLPAARVIKLLVQACASLAEAHEAGLLHRDIKPPNLFACRAADELDIMKLLDFGIVQTVNDLPAKAIALDKASTLDTPRLTQIGAMLGTPGFMAPEQILGMQLDGRADLYSLGCVAWWLLTGREVFAREGGEAKILHKHIYDELPSLVTSVRGWCPPELEAVIASCLAKEMDDRPANARELATRLRAIEVPAVHAWTDARAAAWWHEYKAPEPAPSIPSAEVQVIMPGRGTAERPMSATDERAFDNTLMGDDSRR